MPQNSYGISDRIQSGFDTNPSHKSFYFNCSLANDEDGDCYPSNTAVNTFGTSGNSGRIYDVSTTDAIYQNGTNGKAIHFTGYLGEYVVMNTTDAFAYRSFSISLWVKGEPWFDSYAPIISYIDAGSTAGWILDTQDNGKAIRFGITTSAGDVISPKAISLDPGNFTHIVGTFDGSTITVYKNGELYSSTNYTGSYDPDPKVPLRMGLNSFDTENSWAGAVDDLRIYHRSIGSDEVKAIYDNSSKVTDQLWGYWQFDGNLRDTSGDKNDAIMRVQTVSMTFAPDGRLFFTVKRPGEVRIMNDDKVLPDPFVKLSDLYLGDHEGLLGVTLDPEFETNHFVYLYSTYTDNKTGNPFNRVMRFTDYNNKGTNMAVIMDKIPADTNGYYAGGAISFGPDNMLYVTVGIGNRPEDAQNKSSLLGKLLRVNRDGSIPPDNPFPNSPIFALGLRNAFGIAFDKSGHGIIPDNGDTHFDEINWIQKGGDYGFPNVQYPSIYTVNSNASDFLPPIRAYERVIAPAQAIYYDASKFPDLRGKFVIASYNDGNLRAMKVYQNQTINELVISVTHDILDNIAAVAQSPSGDIYYGGYSIYKLESIKSELHPTMIPVQIDMTPGINITEMKAHPGEKAITINLTTIKAVDLFMKVPKYFIDGKASVSVMGAERANQENNITRGPLLSYQLEPDLASEETMVSVKLAGPLESIQLSINGTRDMPNRITNHIEN